jgi:hypothetical protein
MRDSESEVFQERLEKFDHVPHRYLRRPYGLVYIRYAFSTKISRSA